MRAVMREDWDGRGERQIRITESTRGVTQAAICVAILVKEMCI